MFTRREVNATVTLAHTGTTNLDELLASADVVIAAAGSAHMVKPEQVKEGVIVLDVGVSRVTGEDGTSRVLGDVDPAVKEKAAWMAPNPGGVGPMTRVMLLANVVEAAERAADGEDWAGSGPEPDLSHSRDQPCDMAPIHPGWGPYRRVRRRGGGARPGGWCAYAVAL